MEDSFSLNIQGVSDLIESPINKVPLRNGSMSPEGVQGEELDVLDLPMADEELLDLRDQWEKAYAPYEGMIRKVFKRNMRSYLGRIQDNSSPQDDIPVAANIQFEAEETFLAAALAQDPDPVVYADNTPEGNKISDAVKTMLEFHADQLILRRKLAVMVRQWSVYQLGVLKPGWDEKIKDIAIDNRKIQDFILDPNGFVDAYGDFSSWLGERITVTAEKLIELFPKHRAYIIERVHGRENLGTDVLYTEWWNDDYCFATFKDIVLDKHKNEYFNYQEEGEVDEMTGTPMPVKRNHFASPKKPYVFLSVFSLQDRPHDITGLIEQNIPNQENISRGVEQIEMNVAQGNNGIAFSEDNFNQETAKQASNALTKGVGKVLVPPGKPIQEAIVRIPAPTIPNGYFDNIENNMNNLRSSWGVQGIASQPPKPDTTARGQILNQSHDTTRIGGGIGDAIEQVARNTFNWMVQLYSVFYDEKHFAAVMGVGKAVEYVQLSAQDIDRQLIVTVAPNSMKPKDEVSESNMALELYQAGAIGPKTLLETLEFADPDESAGDGVLWQVDKGAYLQINFPELWQQVQQIAQQQAQAQQAAMQQQAQQQAAQGQQQLSQSAQAHGQQMQQKEQVHQQKLAHTEQSAQQKMEQQKAMEKTKLASVPTATSPKK